MSYRHCNYLLYERYDLREGYMVLVKSKLSMLLRHTLTIRSGNKCGGNGDNCCWNSNTNSEYLCTAGNRCGNNKCEVILTQTGNSKGWNAQGCYTDSIGSRGLQKSYVGDDVSVGRCADLATGFKYFGVEYGKESVDLTQSVSCILMRSGAIGAIPWQALLHKVTAPNAAWAVPVTYQSNAAAQDTVRCQFPLHEVFY
jgi:hypothetical protein